MIKWLKQLWCNHIWKETSSEILGQKNLEVQSWGIYWWSRFAVTYQCVRCQKKKIIEARRNV